jgi:hypothetical protein
MNYKVDKQGYIVLNFIDVIKPQTVFENIDTDPKVKSRSDTYKLIGLLCDYETNNDVKNVKKIYRILNTRQDLESDFWRESFNDDHDWVVRIVLECRKPLSIHDVMLIQSETLFEEALETYKIDMKDFSAIMECIDNDDVYYSEKRIKLVCKYLRKEELEECISYLEKEKNCLNRFLDMYENLLKIARSELKKRI